MKFKLKLTRNRYFYNLTEPVSPQSQSNLLSGPIILIKLFIRFFTKSTRFAVMLTLTCHNRNVYEFQENYRIYSNLKLKTISSKIKYNYFH